MKTGIELITEERQRQIDELNYDFKHDEEHSGGELAMAAMCYAMEPIWRPEEIAPMGWPWHSIHHKDGFKPSPDNRIRELQKSGALIAAEIDRLLWLKEQEEQQ